jgi:hypothetical protein
MNEALKVRAENSDWILNYLRNLGDL